MGAQPFLQGLFSAQSESGAWGLRWHPQLKCSRLPCPAPPLNLTAEVGVTGGIDDINQGVLVVNGGILGKNGNAPLPFQVVGVHDTVRNLFPFAKNTGLLQQSIYQRGFTVIDVGDNRNIADGKSHDCEVA